MRREASHGQDSRPVQRCVGPPSVALSLTERAAELPQEVLVPLARVLELEDFCLSRTVLIKDNQIGFALLLCRKQLLRFQQALGSAWEGALRLPGFNWLQTRE
jgi:hypothetical protein